MFLSMQLAYNDNNYEKNRLTQVNVLQLGVIHRLLFDFLDFLFPIM